MIQKISNLSIFLEKYKSHIEHRLQEVEAWVQSSGKGEQLEDAEHEPEKVRLGIIGELLSAYFLRASFNSELFGEWDIQTLDFSKIDVKTLETRPETSLKNFSNISYYNFFILEKQMKPHIEYMLVYINRAEDTAIIIRDPSKLMGSEIQKRYPAQLKNPQGTSRSGKPQMNHLIRLKDLT